MGAPWTVASVVAELEARADPGFQADLVPRYGIHSRPPSACGWPT